jgi:hypothetical protein
MASKPSLKPRKRPSRKILSSAKAFQQAAKLMEKNPNGPGTKLKDDRLEMPYIANYAFSCELAIKSIEVRHKDIKSKKQRNLESSSEGMTVTIWVPEHDLKKTHNLKNLFAGLHNMNKKAIKEQFKTITDYELEKLLNCCKNYFEEARYNSERSFNEYDLTRLKILADGLIESIETLGHTGLAIK